MTTKRVLQLLLSLLALPSYSQDLKVKEGEFNKVGINLEDSMAMVIFKSDVKGLTIENDAKDSIKVEDNNTVYFIDVGKEINNDGAEFCSRAFYLYCPKSSVYKLQIEDIQPKQVSFYTIVLPDNYPLSLSTEYLYTKTSKHGIRLSFGKRFGFYLAYKWGDFNKAGADISLVNKDYDVTKSKQLGYIRNAFTGGLRFGMLRTEKASAYLLVGGGYGEYGRQWQNPLEIDHNIYFYSDYIRGFEGEISCQCVLFDWLCISTGLDMLMGKRKVSLDYQLGIGVNIPLDKLFYNKKRRI